MICFHLSIIENKMIFTVVFGCREARPANQSSPEQRLGLSLRALLLRTGKQQCFIFFYFSNSFKLLSKTFYLVEYLDSFNFRQHVVIIFEHLNFNVYKYMRINRKTNKGLSNIFDAN